MLMMGLSSVSAAHAGEMKTPTIEEYRAVFEEIMQEYNLDIPWSEEIAESKPSLEEFRKMIKESAELMAAYWKQNEDSIEPDHIPYTVVFSEDTSIDLYIDEHKIDCKLSVIRVGNHDEVLIPIDSIKNILDLNHFKINEGQTFLNPLSDFADSFYLTVIYHNFNKVIIVSPEHITNNYVQTKWDTTIQFNRADNPLTDQIKIIVGKKEAKFPNNLPYVERTHEKDDIMIPLREFEEQLGNIIEWNGNESSATIRINADVFTINMKTGFLYRNGEIIELGLIKPPLIKDDRIYINHEYLALFHGYTFSITYFQNTLYFNE